MPYAVKCFPTTDSGVILCKDGNELGDVCADVVYGLGFRFDKAIEFGIDSVDWVLSGEPVFHKFPITIYRLTEEEYEKWQKAF